MVVLGAFFVIDLVRRQKAHEVEKEKVTIYKAIVSAVHHILNNFLNQMQLFKMTAEDTPGFDRNILSLYDQVIDEASSQIEALSSA